MYAAIHFDVEVAIWSDVVVNVEVDIKVRYNEYSAHIGPTEHAGRTEYRE